MKKNEQKNKRKSISYLVFVIALTAILLVMSTYAWFSTQRDVTITGLTGEVKVAEGLEISLDAENWGQTIDLADANLTGTTGKTYNSYTGNINHKPEDNILAPVSTTGFQYYTSAEQGETNRGQELQFYSGEATSTEVKNITAVKETNTTLKDYQAGYPGYYAFDVFLRNNSRTTDQDATDALQITKDSLCQILQTANTDANQKNEATGLQNGMRVAFALYNGKGTTTDNAAAIIGATTGSSATIKNVAIWEPNANYHVAYTQSYFSRKTPQIIVTPSMITDLTNLNASATAPYYTLDAITGDATNKILRLGTQGVYNTYALNSTSAVAGSDTQNPTNVLTDVYNHTVDTTKVTLQKTLKTKLKFTDNNAVKPENYNIVTEGYQDRQLIVADSETANTNFAIPANATVRLRVYVWLEGQDVDCIANASHGKGVNLVIGLEKQPTANT